MSKRRSSLSDNLTTIGLVFAGLWAFDKMAARARGNAEAARARAFAEWRASHPEEFARRVAEELERRKWFSPEGRQFWQSLEPYTDAETTRIAREWGKILESRRGPYAPRPRLRRRKSARPEAKQTPTPPPMQLAAPTPAPVEESSESAGAVQRTKSRKGKPNTATEDRLACYDARRADGETRAEAVRLAAGDMLKGRRKGREREEEAIRRAVRLYRNGKKGHGKM